MLEAQLRSLKSCIPALVSTGRDRANDDRLTASNWTGIVGGVRHWQRPPLME